MDPLVRKAMDPLLRHLLTSVIARLEAELRRLDQDLRGKRLSRPAIEPRLLAVRVQLEARRCGVQAQMRYLREVVREAGEAQRAASGAQS